MTTLEKIEELIYRSAQEAAQRSREIDRRFQENERLLKERAREFELERKEMREQLYGLTKTLGLFAESMVYPSTIPIFFEYFPRFSGLKLYGAVAGLSVEDSVARYAYKNGLFVLVPAGQLVQIWNDANFIPRTFGVTEKTRPRRKK